MASRRQFLSAKALVIVTGYRAKIHPVGNASSVSHADGTLLFTGAAVGE
ncbi:MAG TPA: hypothetical protein VIM81_14915 [Gammaproteobacteria bacterium]